MRKRRVIILFLFWGVIYLLPASGDPVLEEKEQLLRKGQYSQILALLSKAIRDQAADPIRQALYIQELGDFYKENCGDFRRARQNYRRILGSPIPGNHLLKQSAEEALARLDDLEQNNRELDGQLKKLLTWANRRREPPAIKADISKLEKLIIDNPRYYRLHEVYYALGINYSVLKKPGKAYPLLQKAMSIKPGIIFYLPAKVQAQKARAEHLRNNINNITRAVLWLLLFVTMILFYKARPHKHFRLSHMVPLILLVLSWWLVFNLSHSILGTSFSGGEGRRVIEEAGKDTEYLSASPGSPGSEVTRPLFYYGLIGVVGLFIFSLSIKQSGRGRRVLLITMVFSFLLFSALTTLYYMEYCDRVGTFKPAGKGPLSYIMGDVYFPPEDPEPNILTDPQAYPGIEISKVLDPYLQKWIKNYCPGVIE